MTRGRFIVSAVVLALLGASCSSSNGQPGPSGSTATSSTASPTPSTPTVTVITTLDGLTSLPQRIHWVAKPSAPGDVAEVDFSIDGQLGWVEHSAPYFYGNDGNWLVTSFLKPGTHSFTVKVLGLDGQEATDTVSAKVKGAAASPSGLTATWARTVTDADVKKATSGEGPPPGDWQLSIDSKGWHLRDPQNGGLSFDVVYQSAGRLQVRPTIEVPPYPNPNNGGFCEDTDPVSIWSYSLIASGNTLVLHPVGDEPCGDRIAILEGTWHRVST